MGDPSIKKVETERTYRYIVGEVRRAGTPIRSFLTCRTCHRTTYAPEDVLYKYCENCHQWLDKPDHGGLE